MKRIIAIAVLVVAGCLGAQPASALGRHPRAAARRIWVGRHIVVGRPVVVAPVVIGGVAHGAIDFNVMPETTRVYVDGTMRGKVYDFDGEPGKLNLLPGSHEIRLETPMGDTWKNKVLVEPGREINISLEIGK